MFVQGRGQGRRRAPSAAEHPAQAKRVGAHPREAQREHGAVGPELGITAWLGWAGVGCTHGKPPGHRGSQAAAGGG